MCSTAQHNSNICASHSVERERSTQENHMGGGAADALGPGLDVAMDHTG